jgi:hypothetical protein
MKGKQHFTISAVGMPEGAVADPKIEPEALALIGRPRTVPGGPVPGVVPPAGPPAEAVPPPGVLPSIP